MGAPGKGLPLISLQYAFHSSAKSTKSTFLLTLPITPQALSSQESYFSALDPTGRQKPRLLGDCELEGGNERRGRYRGLEEKDQEPGLQTPKEVQTWPQELPPP